MSILSNKILRDLMLADWPIRSRIAQLRDALEKQWETPRRWTIIREYYRLREPQIVSGWLSPYELGLERFLTPIEEQVWQDIRSIGGMPFFMQYPVGRRFVDFGDPVRKIAIEADGAAYHNEEKDAAKTQDLMEHGWWVIRIKGRDTYGIPGTNRIREIARMYGRDIEPLPEDEYDR